MLLEADLSPWLHIFSWLFSSLQQQDEDAKRLKTTFASFFRKAHHNHNSVEVFQAALKILKLTSLNLPENAPSVIVFSDFDAFIRKKHDFRKLDACAPALITPSSNLLAEIAKVFFNRINAEDVDDVVILTRAVEVLNATHFTQEMRKLCVGLLRQRIEKKLKRPTMKSLMESRLVKELFELKKEHGEDVAKAIKPVVEACNEFVERVKTSEASEKFVSCVDNVSHFNQLMNLSMGPTRTSDKFTFEDLQQYKKKLNASQNSLLDNLQVDAGEGEGTATLARLVASYGSSGDKTVDELVSILVLEEKDDDATMTTYKYATATKERLSASSLKVLEETNLQISSFRGRIDPEDLRRIAYLDIKESRIMAHMYREEKGKKSAVPDSTPVLLESMPELVLHKLNAMTDPANVKFGEVKELAKSLGSEKNMRDEFRKIFQCFGVGEASLDFDVILRLASLAYPLQCFIIVCNDNFRDIACRSNDGLKKLQEYSEALEHADTEMSNFSIDECKQRERQILQILSGGKTDADDLLTILNLFVKLRNSEEFWKFFVDVQEWHGDAGIETFNGMYENVTNIKIDAFR